MGRVRVDRGCDWSEWSQALFRRQLMKSNAEQFRRGHGSGEIANRCRRGGNRTGVRALF